MTRRIGIVVSTLALTAAWTAAAEPDTLARLDQALKAVGAYEYGKDFAPLRQVEDLVVQAAQDPKLRAEAEKRLIAALRAAKTSDAKSFLCRRLRTIGTARCVPALAALLPDEKLSHMARYALGRIEQVEAANALFEALPKTSGRTQVGIINTLANRGYHKILPDLEKLIQSRDAAVAEAAAAALGQLGGAQCAEALEKARAKATGRLRGAIDDARIRCAEACLANQNPAMAVRIYRTYYAPKQPKHLRVAALRGLVAAQPEEAARLVLAALKDNDAMLRLGAVGHVRTLKAKGFTQAVVALMPSLDPQTQARVLAALANRGERAALPAAVAATKSQHEDVRVAALEALGSLGDATTVALLAPQAANAKGTEQQAARASLVRLPGKDVDQALAAPFAKATLPAGQAALWVEMLRALAGRGAVQAMDAVAKAARDQDPAVRREAIRAIGVLARDEHVGTLIGLLHNPRDKGDQPAVEQALVALCRRIKDKEQAARRLAASLPGARLTGSGPAIVRLLGRLPCPTALETTRAAVRDRDAAVQDAAVRALAAWPTAAPAEDLLTLARASKNQAHRVLALRGYVRMAGESKDPTKLYVRAMTLAERPDDKKLVLAGLGTADTPEALGLAEQYLADDALRNEAALAVAQIADRLRSRDESRARAALAKALAAAKDPAVRQKAQDVVNEMEKLQGYIRDWMAAGPYQEKGKQSDAIFKTAFPPEKADAKDVKWAKLTRGVGSWDINLEATFGSRDHCAAYLRTRVWSPVEQPARLELGSDDAIKAWLNGTLVHANYVQRGMGPAQDQAKAQLRKGWNELLLKVVDHEGGWSAACRIRKPDGSALDGLKIEAK